MHLDDNKVVGGAEFVPSPKVPYAVPKEANTAFLTCIYHSSTEWDYKVYPLYALEKKLSNKYNRVIAICDEIGTFPNGNVAWFKMQGYEDLGLISVEEDYCRLHLVEKWLK